MHQIYLIMIMKFLIQMIYYHPENDDQEDDLEIPAFLRRQKN